MRYKARAPLRIDFAGGWTDIPEFASSEGGSVVNAAITQYVRGFISRAEASGILGALRGNRSYLQYSVDVPTGAGLGASAAQTVLWVTLVRASVANTAERADIARISCQIAADMGIVGGKQDEYASALGGVHSLTFGQDVRAERLELTRGFLNELRQRLVLVYTGRSRLSPSIHTAVWSRFREGDPSTVTALRSLKHLGAAMRGAFLAGEVEEIAVLMNENWAAQRALHPSVTNDDLDTLIHFALTHGARGAKACGAGGGGCVLLVAAEGDEARLRRALLSRSLRIIDFDFDTYGVHLTKA